MKFSLLELIEIEKSKGYSDDNASAKVCQDLILEAIAIARLIEMLLSKEELLWEQKLKMFVEQLKT